MAHFFKLHPTWSTIKPNAAALAGGERPVLSNKIMRWSHAQPQGRLRKPCEGHTISVVDQKVYMLFGKHEDDASVPICPPLFVLDMDSMTTTIPPFGVADGRRHIPADREGHTASVVGRKIFIFGGTWTDDEDNTVYMNDLHVLETASSLGWSQPNTTGVPPIEREGHTAAVVGSRIFVFGGTWVDEEDNSIYLNDLHHFDTENLHWAPCVTSGEKPIQREGHTASVLGTQMVVFGGAGLDADDNSVNLSDLHVLDTETMVWSQPRVRGSVPQERRYHSACVIDGQVLVFGGQYYDAAADLHFECDNALCVYDIAEAVWTTQPASDSTPLRRACHAAGVVGKRMVLVGGRYWDVREDDYIFLNDVQILDTTPDSTLAIDWRSFVNNPHLSDIEIHVGGQIVPAHRVVLAARCGYFRGMFESGMRDASSSTVTIDDVPYPVFMALLEHLYTGDVDVPPEDVLELFAAADFLGVDQLKARCVAMIEAGLCVDNVCAALSVADKHCATALKETCVGFIVNDFKQVHSTDGFRELSRALLELVHAGISERLGSLKIDGSGSGAGGGARTPGTTGTGGSPSPAGSGRLSLGNGGGSRQGLLDGPY